MKKQMGFTLIEIMIALLLGLIVIGATISVYIASVKGSADVIKSARLNYDLDSALSLMANDIRRAGYWGGAVAGSNPADNPFMQANTNLRISDPPNCIEYTYDSESPIGNGNVNDTEYYGFKLNGTSLQMRLSCTAADKADCSCASDANNDWATITVTDGGQAVEITKLEFSLTTPNHSKCLDVSKIIAGAPESDYAFPDKTCQEAADDGDVVAGDIIVESRQVNIVLEGRIANDTAVTKTLSQSVKLRNDRIVQW